MSKNTRRYFEELDKQLKGRSPTSPEFEALLRSKIGGQFQGLVTPENLEKMYLLGRPEEYNPYGGVNAREFVKAGRTPAQIATKLEKDFSSVLREGERVPEGKTIIGIGRSANPNVFTHELRHELGFSPNKLENEVKNRFYDLVYGSTSYPAYLTNVRRVHQAALQLDPEFKRGKTDADFARRRQMSWYSSDKEKEDYVLKSPYLRELLSPGKEGVSLPSRARNLFSDIVNKNYKLNVSGANARTENLPKDAIELRSKFPFLNFVGSVEDSRKARKDSLTNTQAPPRRRAAGSPRSGEKKTPNQEDLRKLMLAMNPDAEQIEEAVAAAPRVPEAARRLGKGFYEANVEPLLSPIETTKSLINLGREFIQSPVETGKTVAKSELERLKGAGDKPEAAAEYYGSLLSPFSMLRRAPTVREIKAYHGSPTQFEPTAESMLGEFDVAKAGRGVGQQNRGPGTYIAENPKVANRYRIATGSVDPKKGFMYTVDLPDPMIEKMIDLDAPIVNQPKIRETLLKIADDGVLPPESANYLRYMLTNPDRELQKYPLTGQGLIAVPRELGGIFKDVTEANTILQQYGIPGSKWKDDVSRGPNKGTRNFVVFPGEEKKVKILEREGPGGERTTAAPVGRTPQAPPVYHVTQTKYLPNIKKKGLLPLQTSNWVKASNRERYGGGDVYAFSTREDAERWAAKMDWAFNQKIGSGKISIVTVNRPENVKFDIDQNDPISQISNAGPWLKTSERIPAKNIVSAEEFTKDTAPGFFGNVIGKATDGE